ncbi:MAG: HD domain-containing protein [Bacteroidota bacterium]
MNQTIDRIQYAWQLAAYYHEGQRYYTPTEGETLPYLTHLGAVTLEAQAALQEDLDLDADLTLLCAILHDSLEDTGVSASELEAAFGPAVLAGVSALTKDESLPTKQTQMRDSLRRIKEQPREVAVVKLCDRIVNLAPAPAHWPADKRLAYREEASLILEELGSASAYLKARLERKISEYNVNGE